MKKIYRSILVGVGAITLAACARIEPVYNVNSKMVPSSASANAVKNCLVQSAQARGWRTAEVKPGLIRAGINQHGHVAQITMTYSSKNYSINYASSENMMAGNDGTIHRNYNKWIKLLDRDTQACLAASK